MDEKTDPFSDSPQNRNDEESRTLVESLLNDQRNRWKQGEDISVETLLEQEPSIQTNTEVILDLIYQEITLREAKGEKPHLDEYLSRFPHLKTDLEILFEVEEALDPANLLNSSVYEGTDAADTTDIFRTSPKKKEVPDKDEIPGYEILEEIGHGGMGVVLKANQHRPKRTVAIKMLLGGYYANKDALARFRIEADAIAKIQHPNIVQIYEVNEVNGKPYLALEYVSGGSLSEKLLGTPLPAKDAAELTQTLALALHAAHTKGVIHRDLKPANILLLGKESDSGKNNGTPESFQPADYIPKVTDFGLAKMLEATEGQTESGAFLGTPSYSAPEQVSDNRNIGPQTDVYALGAILYEFLTGRPPFKGTTPFETLGQVQKEEPVPPSRLQMSVPKDLETICLKCLQKDIRKRYESALDLADEIERYQKGQPILARPIGPVERLVKWGRRNPAIAALLGVIAIAAVSLVVGFWRYSVGLALAAEREKIQREKAEDSFRQAIEAVERMLTEVGDVELADIPQMEPVRMKLLARAQKFYNGFLAERGNDPAFRYLAGRAYSRLGDIQEWLNEHKESEQSYQQAFKLLSGNDDFSARKELARAFNNAGTPLKKTGRYKEAKEYLQEAIQLRRKLARENPKKLRLQQNLAASYYDLATVLAKMPNQRENAKHCYRKALGIQKSISRLEPNNPEFIRAQAKTLNNLGILLSSESSSAPAEVFALAIGLQKQLVNDHPFNPTYRRELARSYNNFAAKLIDTRQAPEAEEEYKKALEILQQLVRDFPSVPTYQEEMAAIHFNRGSYFRDIGKLTEGEKYFAEALKYRSKLAKRYPKIPGYQLKLARVYEAFGITARLRKDYTQAGEFFGISVDLLAKIAKDPGSPTFLSAYARSLSQVATVQSLQAFQPEILKSGKTKALLEKASSNLEQAIIFQGKAYHSDKSHELYAKYLKEHYLGLIDVSTKLRDHYGAAETARELIRQFPEDAEVHVLAAKALSLCLRLLSSDSRLASNEKEKRAEKYGRNAVRYLRFGIEKGYRRPDQLFQNPIWNPIRSREDFQKLKKESEEGSIRIG